jgi:TRAP-type C4-dicarboxylate transport system substrate-binding protein
MRKLGLALLVLMLCGISQAAVLKIATVTPEGSQWMKEMRASAKEISERTNGRVQIKDYGGGVMGNDTKVLGKIRIGALHGGAFTPTALMERYADINLYGLPLIFDSEDEAAYVRERLDARLEKGLEAAGFVNFGFAAGGFAVLMSNAPVRGLDDLRGKRVWVPEGDSVSYASMEALELSPVTLPLTDVLTGLQTGLLDIVAMSPIGGLVLQWHTKIKFITELPLVYTMGVMAIEKRVFDKISTEDQAVVREVMTRTYIKLGRENLAVNADAKQAMLDTGIQAVVPDANELSEIREVLQQSNRRLGEQGMFSYDLYKEMMSYVDEYRRNKNSYAAGK